MKSYGVVVVALMLVLSACASASESGPGSETTTSAPTTTSTIPDTTTTTPEPRTLVMTITEEGGCFMMGPNCATYLFYSDGSVELMRTGETGEPEARTTIDPKAVKEIQDLLASTDLDALRATLPEGECQGCYDGIDTVFTYETPDGQVSFASVDEELILAEPLFAATWTARDAAAQDVELPLRERP